MPSPESRSIAIVGAGQAGFQAAQSLRKRGFEGSITLLGNEGHAPYQRPPLSKAYLKGEFDEARLCFKPDEFYDDRGIACRWAATVETIDTNRKLLSCADGTSHRYDVLILSTGSSPVALPVPGRSVNGIFALRGIDDARAIRARLEKATRLVVVGGGYIGLEVAAAARQLGLAVSVVERMPRLMSRVTSPPISDFYLGLHRGRGVDVRLDETVDEIEGDVEVTGVRLGSGECIPAQLALIGIGAKPNDQLAAAANIDCDDGILVDSRCRTSAADVYAAGDCARTVRPDGTSIRLESVHNALVQAERIAADIVGDPPPAFDPPWFWSDQYEIKLQTVGLFNDYTDIVVLGQVGEAKFSALYFRDDRFVALDAVNDPISFMAAKQTLKKGVAVRRSDVPASAANFKEVIARLPGEETV